MFDWVLAPGDARPLLRQIAARTLAGGDVALSLVEPVPGRPVTVAQVTGAHPRRPVAWPELLVDWAEIHEAQPYPGEATPALAQTLSAVGVPAFAVALDPARDAAAVAWYERGALLLLEHVGSSTVAWSPEAGLGRPRMSGLAGGAVSLARQLTDDDGGTILDRIEAQHAAGARAIVERVLVRLCDRSPQVDELAGLVALAPVERLRV